MKKLIKTGGIVLIALFLLCSCDPNANNGDVVQLDIPSEFHGMWQSVEVDPDTGLHELLTISSHEMIGDGTSMTDINALIESTKKQAEDMGVNFSSTFSQSHQAYGRYNFNLMLTMGYSTLIVNFTLALDGNNGLVMAATITQPGQTKPMTPNYTTNRDASGNPIISVENVELNFPTVFKGEWLSEDNITTGEQERIVISNDDFSINGVSLVKKLNAQITGLETKAKQSNMPLSVTFSETIEDKYYYFRVNINFNGQSELVAYMFDLLENDVMNYTSDVNHQLDGDIYNLQ